MLPLGRVRRVYRSSHGIEADACLREGIVIDEIPDVIEIEIRPLITGRWLPVALQPRQRETGFQAMRAADPRNVVGIFVIVLDERNRAAQPESGHAGNGNGRDVAEVLTRNLAMNASDSKTEFIDEIGRESVRLIDIAVPVQNRIDVKCGRAAED